MKPGDSKLKEIYEATYDVPEFNIKAGDFVVARPGDSIVPFQHIIHYGHNDLLRIMPHLEHFTRTEFSVNASPSARTAPPRSTTADPRRSAPGSHLRVLR